ncbi:MAG: hypothetical protein Q8M92_10625 [Candidatus Subteraquimicrobiales bacterium]|nr:hypothetical protein [Candidatus Subteraquimicrobiales bacterium]
MKNEMEEKKLKRVKFISNLSAVVILIIALPCLYLLASMVLGEVFQIKLPQPFPLEPRTTILSNPLYDKSAAKGVSPKEIQEILDKHPYGRYYEKGVFDCSDMSIITARFLQEEYGYDTFVVVDDSSRHAWVYVWTDKNRVWAIETASESSLLRRSAGEIMGDDWWDIVFLGRWLDSQFVTKGYEFYYPSKMRKGLRILEWNEAEKYIK